MMMHDDDKDDNDDDKDKDDNDVNNNCNNNVKRCRRMGPIASTQGTGWSNTYSLIASDIDERKL